MVSIAQKNRVRIVLDLEIYDDFDTSKIEWEKLLELEGDETVYATVKDYDEIYGL
jgi:hypothetical protein